MSIDEIKKRFVDEIKLRAYDDKYVDKNEEREILQVAIQQGISIDSARSAHADCTGHVLAREERRESSLKPIPELARSGLREGRKGGLAENGAVEIGQDRPSHDRVHRNACNAARGGIEPHEHRPLSSGFRCFAGAGFNDQAGADQPGDLVGYRRLAEAAQPGEARP